MGNAPVTDIKHPITPDNVLMVTGYCPHWNTHSTRGETNVSPMPRGAWHIAHGKRSLNTWWLTNWVFNQLCTTQVVTGFTSRLAEGERSVPALYPQSKGGKCVAPAWQRVVSQTAAPLSHYLRPDGLLDMCNIYAFHTLQPLERFSFPINSTQC